MIDEEYNDDDEIGAGTGSPMLLDVARFLFVLIAAPATVVICVACSLLTTS